MSDMPERINAWLWNGKTDAGGWHANGQGTVETYIRHDAPELVALVEALRWFEGRRKDAIARAKTISAPEDAAVKALCDRYGYGAVMDSAARQWAKLPAGSAAFFVGGCIGDKSAETALAAYEAMK